MSAPGSVKLKINLSTGVSSTTTLPMSPSLEYMKDEPREEGADVKPSIHDALSRLLPPDTPDNASRDVMPELVTEAEIKPESPEDQHSRPQSSADGDGLLNLAIKTHTEKSRKRKHIKTNFNKFEASLPEAVREAQKREQERLKRLADRNVDDNDHINQMAALVSADPLPEVIVMDDDFMNDEELEEKRMREGPSRADPEVVTLSSDDEDDIIALGGSEVARKNRIGTGLISFTSYGRPISMSSRGRWGAHHEEAAQENLARQRLLELKRLRKRRPSRDLESRELTEGKLLVNAGRPEGDPPIYVAPHLTHTLQPHQLGGIRFMFDNVIDSAAEYKKSEGFGCILAHSMGLGKTIQVITFTEIFFRATEARKVLVIVPINTIQNWFNEFNKWMPEFGPSGEPLRKFPVFILGDSVKGLEQRVKLIEDWHREGGVLLIGYEMFRTIIKATSPKKNAKAAKIKLNTLNGLTDELEKEKEARDTKEFVGDGGDRRSLAEIDAVVRTALLDPGPDLVVCDEGHKIKNLNTATSVALNDIRTKRRIVLTGTPLQNNLLEYFCMVDFVRPMFLGTKKSFVQMFEKPIKNGQCVDSTYADQKLAAQRTHVLKESLKGFVQRRTHSLLKQILPQCREYVLLLRKSPIQHALYRAFVLYAKSEMDTGNTGTFNPLKAFAACSKIWNHPDVLHLWLQRRKELDAKVEAEKNAEAAAQQKAVEEKAMAEAARQQQQWQQQLIPHHQPIFPGGPFSNPFPSTMFSAGNGMGYPQYGYQPHPFMQPSFYPNGVNMGVMSDIGMMCGGLQVGDPNVPPSTCAPNGFNGLPQNGGNFSCSVPSTSSGYTGSPYALGPPLGNGLGFSGPSVPNANDLDRVWSEMGSAKDLMPQKPPVPGSSGFGMPACSSQPGPSNCQPQLTSLSQSPEKEKKNKSIPGRCKTVTLASVLQEELELDAGLKYDWAEVAMSSYMRGAVENGYKLLIAMDIINEAARRGEKILLFSQNLTTLDVIEDFLSRAQVQTADDSKENWQRGVNYFRFDGTVNGVEREKLINRFNSEQEIRLFIISTRAGSLGINLVSANRCILFDACWNPCHDAQAVCRVYRYGQQRRTYIYRLIMDNSMERAIFNRQISKHGLSQRVVDDLQVDANITQKELETLLVYDEALDVQMGTHDTSKWEIDDDVLRRIVDKHTHLFAGAPFLHESLMLESEEKLSEAEKLEAQLLFEKVRRGETIEEVYPLDNPMFTGTPPYSIPNGGPNVGRLLGARFNYPSQNFGPLDPPPLRAAPMPKNLQLAPPSGFRFPGGGATMATLRNDAQGSLFGPRAQSMNPFDTGYEDPRASMISRVRGLPNVQLLGEPDFKVQESAMLQRIVLMDDVFLRTVDENSETEIVPAQSALMLVVKTGGTYAKDLERGKVYNCSQTPLDLGCFPSLPMPPSRLRFPASTAAPRMVPPIDDCIQLD